MIERLSLRIRVFLFFVALAAGNLGAIIAGIYAGYHRIEDPAVFNAFIQGGIITGFTILGLITWVWFLFDKNVARPIERLAGGIRARTHAEVSAELDHTSGKYLGDLAPAALAVTQYLAETRDALSGAVERETARLETEKGRLETLLSDVPVGVLLCTADHQLVFYNGQAVDLLGRADTSQGPGLDRGLFEYLHHAPIEQAWARLRETDDHDAASDLLCATTGSGKVLAARMRLLAEPVGSDGTRPRPGYVLTLRDVSSDLASQAEREALIDEMFDRVRRPAANLLSVIGVVTEAGGALPEKLGGAMLAEVTALAQAVTELAARHDAARAEWRPLSLVRASDLTEAIRARAGAEGVVLDVAAQELILRCDGFELAALMASLAARLASGRQGLRVEIGEDGPGALIALAWQGPAVSVSELDRWLDAPLEVGMPDLTGRRVLATHATEIWPEPLAAGEARICLPLREVRRAHKRPAPVLRAVVYDFDLLLKDRPASLMAARLDDLTYVVFDTETTGLLPAQGDEIVQIAGVRIVNGRRLEKEVFDALVNPGRPIPSASTEVHGITDAMVADAPDIADVGRRFHAFAKGAVLVAHNAPFDVEFLRRKQARIGAVFDHPTLDTVLLSAVVFGQGESHSLDALTHRLGITIPEEARHTAIGDTVATAEAFLKLLPSLKARGLETFGDVLREVRKHGRLLKDLNG
ncbi:MAG: exonuclease domain-containing protein [Phaeovulum sp.]|uniref:3'-5' exonuclease n=1 Tax=Phaeovulum sp. TaxID=2934796 RepID=UPI0027321568|nr:exonuclease domain-containing protein [Phaeovulum sp.]MDP2061734.1 exonuclease domain-containing protein [Phaeovulum sp.]